MIHTYSRFKCTTNNIIFLNNFYLDITHLVSVFNIAGGKICLLHIDVTKQTVRRYLLYNCKQKTCKKFLYYDSFTSKNPIQHTHTFVDQAEFMSSCRTKSYRVVLKNRNGQILTKHFPENKLHIYTSYTMHHVKYISG